MKPPSSSVKKLSRGRRSYNNGAEESAAASVGVISKVLRILEALQGSSVGLSLKKICELTAVHKSTAHRFLKHLVSEGYLIRGDGGRYLIGPKLAQMSAHVSVSAILQTAARPVLSELWNSTHETVNLGILDQGKVLYVDVIESPHEFRLVTRIGNRRSIHATALGKALAAFLPNGERESILNRVVFESFTPQTIINLVQFREELEKVRREGYAVDNEEVVQGARCVSAPILNNEGLPIAAISVSGPVTRVTPGQVPALANAVRGAAAAISVAMGFQPSHRLTRLRSAAVLSGRN